VAQVLKHHLQLAFEREEGGRGTGVSKESKKTTPSSHLDAREVGDAWMVLKFNDGPPPVRTCLRGRMDEVELRQSTSGSLHAAEFLPPHKIVGRSRFRPLIPVRLLSLGARLAAVSSNEDKRRPQVTLSGRRRPHCR